MATMANLCQIKPYTEGDDVDCFLERVEQYFKACDVADTKQVSTLLMLIDEKSYKTLKSMFHPTLPKEKSYTDLEAALKLRFRPRVSYYRKRAVFDKAVKNEGESISKWYERVREIAAECEFGTEFEQRVKDKFVTGIRSGPIFERLCEEPVTKEIANLLDIALNKESALLEKPDSVCVNKVRTIEKKSAEGNVLLCIHCGKSNHSFAKCKYKTYKCKICGKIGHLALVCKSKPTHTLEVQEEEDENGLVDILTVEDSALHVNYVAPYSVQCYMGFKSLNMELDTGAAVSCIPEEMYKNIFSDFQLQPANCDLKTYNGQIVKPLGKITVPLKCNNKKIDCSLLIVKNGCKCLFGRDLIEKFKIEIKNYIPVNLLQSDIVPTLDSVLQRFTDVFKAELGKIEGEKIKLELLDENIKPIFHKPRPIPHAYRDKVDSELSKLEKEGVITKVENTNWGTPLVPVLKENGQLRLCANYKITINKYLKDVNHPLPRIEDIFTALQGGEKFTKLDLRNAFNQLICDDDTGNLLAWSTPKGIYRLNRLPYGTKPASAIFQAKLEKVLLGAKGVVNFIDDVLVTGANDQEHLENLEEVLKRFQKVGIRLNKNKCLFFQEEVKYLGHIISKGGLKKDKSKLDGLINAPPPSNVTEIRSWIGMVNYYSKFIPKMSLKLKPLYDLLQKDTNFVWSQKCNDSFEMIKQDIVSENTLVHFNRNLPLRLSCDASQNGIGAVLSHVMPDGSDRPISFISRVYRTAEKNYSMIHKEALAIYWAVQTFYQYLVGTKFELQSDHKPLQALFGENRSLPQMAAGRLQRWSLYLAGFDYTFKHIKGTDNVKADCMSRLPVTNDVSVTEATIAKECDYINFVEEQNVIDLNMVRSETRKDSTLSSVYNMIRYGFPKNVTDESIKPFFRRKDELYIDQNVIMWGYRVVIPEKLRFKLLKELHAAHEGIVKMKTNARSYFWWPGLDDCIENMVKNCNICMSARPEPPKSNVIPWPKCSFPYERVHADFLGPIDGKMILLIVDSYSKWPEAFIMKSLEAKLTVEKFRECFSRYGLPYIVVTDNAATFCSKDFSEFLQRNGIKHQTSAPFHPATNGLAENAVRNFKSGLLKALQEKNSVSFETLMNRYLFHYRNSIHSTTGSAPATLMFQRKLRTRLDLLTNKNCTKEEKVNNYGGERNVTFKEGESVYCRDYRNPNKKRFVKAVIEEVLGKRTYLCKIIDEELVWKRHLDQIISCSSQDDNVNDYHTNINESSKEKVIRDLDNSKNMQLQNENNLHEEEVLEDLDTETGTENNDVTTTIVPKSPVESRTPRTCSKDNEIIVRRSSRIIKPPQRLNL